VRLNLRLAGRVSVLAKKRSSVSAASRESLVASRQKELAGFDSTYSSSTAVKMLPR